MKFPVLGMVLALMLGQYAVLDFSFGLAHGLAAMDSKTKLASVDTHASPAVFCRQPVNATWQCTQG
ncbi:hypothetical protein [Pararhizobium sp. IMCC21322]|uniref:hypothetical protein n=1 Tax=Pararhizobium sp. IMCC21322 TaxID=3067903 RepID=UPI0027415024|nr:hypothetical protein [Pararhizobium sp. IMCC21322]